MRDDRTKTGPAATVVVYDHSAAISTGIALAKTVRPHLSARGGRPDGKHANAVTSLRWQTGRSYDQTSAGNSDRGGGNFEVESYAGLILKASYWRWPEKDMAGNAIDFYVKVLGASFSDAMKELLAK